MLRYMVIKERPLGVVFVSIPAFAWCPYKNTYAPISLSACIAVVGGVSAAPRINWYFGSFRLPSLQGRLFGIKLDWEVVNID